MTDAGKDAIRAAATAGRRLGPGATPPTDARAIREQNLRLADLERNDLGNAERLLARHGQDLLFVRGLGEHVWADGHWTEDGAAEQWRRRGHETARSIAEEAQAMSQAPPPHGWTAADWADHAAKHLGWARESGNSARTSAMIREATQYASVGPDELDADPFALNCANGTLELQGACETLRPHAREGLLAKRLPVAFDAAAAAPRWQAFMAEVLPDPAVRAFVQRWHGYCLTGDTREQRLVFYYGQGGNGKSVAVDTIARIMGGYASTLGIESLLLGGRRQTGGEPTPDLARLAGARFVRASEPPSGARFDEARVKALTGGEPITVRKLHHDFFELRPRFKLTISGNHKPAIRGADLGIWRRFLLVPWEVNIPHERQDPLLPERLWQERAGILNWLLDGLRLWLERGLAVPASVLAATDDFRVDGDPVGRFVADCLVPMPGQNEPAREVYNAYSAWCRANAETVFSERAFAAAMAERGMRKLSTRIRLYADVLLREVPAAPEDDDVGYY